MQHQTKMGEIENLAITKKKRTTIGTLNYSDQNEQTIVFFFAFKI